jgi:hypothetical protein
MRKVNFPEPDTPEWIAWRKDCKQAIKDLISLVRNNEPIEIDNNLYKRQKTVIFQAFDDKCAFCESRLLHNQPGDVEHFRPKKTPTDKENNRVCRLNKKGKPIKKNGEVDLHKGYYWLAYEWSNLLPSCTICNRSYKRNRFPIAGVRAFKPGKEKDEKPLLLNPLIDNPGKHFKLDPEVGILAGLTPKGEMCIEVLGLNREELVEERIDAYFALESLIKTAHSESVNLSSATVKNALNKIVMSYKGSGEYSFATKHALKKYGSLLLPFEMILPFSLKRLTRN